MSTCLAFPYSRVLTTQGTCFYLLPPRRATVRLATHIIPGLQIPTLGTCSCPPPPRMETVSPPGHQYFLKIPILGTFFWTIFHLRQSHYHQSHPLQQWIQELPVVMNRPFPPLTLQAVLNQHPLRCQKRNQ